MMKKMKKLFLAAICLLVLSVLLSALAACASDGTSDSTDPTDTQTTTQPDENISITVKVIHGDGSEKTFEIETSEDTLLGALLQENLVEGDDSSPTGFYITTVDGEEADYSADQSWWCLTQNGEMLMTGAGTTEISDGQTYEITYTIG